MNTFFIVLLTIISLEVVFNILYFLKNKKIYKKKKKILYSRIHYIGHPYLPFVLKKRFKNHGNTSIDYPIKQKYELTSPELKSNNLGFYNGNNGNNGQPGPAGRPGTKGEAGEQGVPGINGE